MISGNPKYIKDIHYQTADAFLKSISYGGELYNVFDHKFIFRGHASDKYELTPYLLRRGVVDSYIPKTSNLGEYHSLFCGMDKAIVSTEYSIIHSFFDIADRNGLYLPNIDRLRATLTLPLDSKFFAAQEKWLPEEFWEVAALAQHYGLPTRLLDWSYDLYVSLYFAAQQILYANLKSGKELLAENSKYIIEGFRKIRGKEFKKEITDNKQDEPKIELWAMDYKTLMSESFMGNLKDFQLRIIRPSYSGNPNLAAQFGLFTLWQIDKRPLLPIKDNLNFNNPTPLDQLITDSLDRNQIEIASPVFYRITIPKTESVAILEFLFNKGYNAARLFPGYGGVSKAIEEENRLLNLKER